MTAAVRRHGVIVPRTDSTVAVGDLDGQTRWGEALAGVDAVVHLAGRAHAPARTENDRAAYWRTNVEATTALARQAVAAGVRQFVFVSSVKVNGEGRERPYTADDAPAPEDAYGWSKLEAERALLTAAESTQMTSTIVRPPLVYGPRVRANFLRLMTAVDRGLPLPFGMIRNRRSLIYVGNLADALDRLLDNHGGSSRTFLVSDGEDLSTPELVRRIGVAVGRAPLLLPVPPVLLKILGRVDAVSRLTGSLTVDIEPIARDVGWQPRWSVAQGLAATAVWYRTERDR